MTAKTASRITVIVVFGLIGLGLLIFSFTSIWGCIPLALGLLGLAFCLKEIPADPPHIGVVKIRGKRTGETKKEGWRFLAPFFPFLYDVILVDVTKKNKDLPSETIRTPDLAQLLIPISLTWTPNENYIINYLNSGGEIGVWDILADIVRERVRSWAMNRQEGPMTFEEALAAKEDAVEVLIKAVAGEELDKIPSRVPTTILFKYFNEPQIEPTESETKKWGQQWERVAAILETENKNEIRKAIKNRKSDILKIQRGNGAQDIPQLGITLNRLNIGDIIIKPGSELDQAAEKEIKEKREMAAEKIETQNIMERITELMQPPFNFTAQEARDIVQTERGKVSKDIKDIQGLDRFGQGIGEGLGKTILLRKL